MADQEAGVGAISTEKVAYRGYIKTKTVDDGQGNVKTVIDKLSILSETEKKEPATIKGPDGTMIPNPYAGLSTTWANAEREGYTAFNNNDVIVYDLKDLSAFETLCPDPAIRLYIVQTGLSSIQTARANAFVKAQAENTSEPTPLYNDETLDLQVGIGDDSEFSFNKAPSRRGLSGDEKMVRMLTAAGYKPEAIAAALAFLKTQQAEDSAAGVQAEEAA